MYLTNPQSSLYDPAKFEGLKETDNHFDWDLFYKFKDKRTAYWLKIHQKDEFYRTIFQGHFIELFKLYDTIQKTIIKKCEPVKICDVGTSSKYFDSWLAERIGAIITVVENNPNS